MSVSVDRVSLIGTFITFWLVCVCACAQAQTFVSTGGKRVGNTLCPQEYNDVIVPITSLAPEVDANEPTMTISGVWEFIQAHNITRIEQLIARLPEYYRTNFSLMEVTRATGQSDLTHPRIILYGPDGSFLANVGSKPDDPKYHLLDVAQLHRDTGEWEFSVFDFNGPKPKLTRRDPSCNECHGYQNKRPVWGDHLLWTGAFGDNLAPGPNGEALDSRHLEQFERLRDGGGGPRFASLIWDQSPLIRGGKRKLANHAFGADLLMSSIIIGSASARGAFLQLKNTHPEAYEKLREVLLLLHYEHKSHVRLSAQERSQIEHHLRQMGLGNDYPVDSLDNLLSALGVNPNEAFSLNTLADKETPNVHWRAGAGDMYDLVMLQVLDDARRHNPAIQQLLTETVSQQGVIDCPDTVKTIDQLVSFKILHLFQLQGRARYEVHRVYYPLDLEDIHARVFLPVTQKLTAYLRSAVASDTSASMASE